MPIVEMQLREVYPIATPLQQAYENESAAYALTFDGVTMYESAQVLYALLMNYANYYMSAPKILYNTNYFYQMWENFKAGNLENLYRMYQAMTAEYNPINNYDMVEESADGQRKDKTTTEATPTGTTSTTSRTYRTGLNSVDDGVLTDKVTSDTTPNNVKTTGTETPDNTKAMTFGNEVKTGYHETNEHYLKRSGNIGVTTSAQMIQGEIDLRKHDLLMDYLARFIARNCFYVG